MRPGIVTNAGRVRAGDEVLVDGTFVAVTQVKKAQGRKPKVGENLHLVTHHAILKRNSTAPVRIRPRVSV